MPIRHAYRPWVNLCRDRVAVAVGAELVAEHLRAFCRLRRSSMCFTCCRCLRTSRLSVHSSARGFDSAALRHLRAVPAFGRRVVDVVDHDLDGCRIGPVHLTTYRRESIWILNRHRSALLPVLRVEFSDLRGGHL